MSTPLSPGQNTSVAESPDWAEKHCPSCGSGTPSVFYEVRNVPVHSVLLTRAREQALAFPTGDVVLAYCSACGFVTNVAFEPGVQNYSAEYEETQGFSNTFNAFHKRLAEDLIDRYDLHSKKVIEIGCGKGDFLNLLCTLGNNHGVGFDPAYVPERNASPLEGVTFIQDFYSEKYADYRGDLVCCKMTLEHIQNTADFVGTVQRSLGDHSEAIVFFQVPEVTRILRDLAFWDVYYEHCSYFSRGSLGRLFRRQRFDVLNLWTDYDDQYLMIEARPRTGAATSFLSEEDDLTALRDDVSYFARHIHSRLDAWRRLLQVLAERGQRVVLWGGGSKAVAFLTTLGVRDEVACAVDINPYKQGTFLAGTGHEIVGPGTLSTLKPDVVIIMNPVYREEIRLDLHQMDLSPELLDIDLDPSRLRL